MNKLHGNKGKLKASQIKRLEKLYQRHIPPEFIITPDFAHEICSISHEIRRQIGLLVNRNGKVIYVIIGTSQKIFIPDLSDYRSSTGRLRGLKCIHTHINGEQLTEDDLADLTFLHLDIIAALTMDNSTMMHQAHLAHILPRSTQKPFQILPPIYPGQLNINCNELIMEIESELNQISSASKDNTGQERAILVSVTTAFKQTAADSLTELEDLSASCGIKVIKKILQQRKKIDSKFLLGSGKLQELSFLALTSAATLIVFDQELNPSQVRSITDKIDLKVIDRTQLILDIFAQRAKSKEGKFQVELAQLKYLLPHLTTKNTAMSRLTGEIGGRGPGETKLEINKRRVRESIKRLEKSISKIKKQRREQRSKRSKKGIPVISIIGYTNAGKSTLLNSLTSSRVDARNQLFATLDPASRRLRFPNDAEVIITDTVGFIKNLPRDLMASFSATLEELETADTLLHVIDISNPRFEEQIKSVEKIILELNLQNIRLIRVLNKQDRIDKKTVENYSALFDGIPISARDKLTLIPLIEQIKEITEIGEHSGKNSLEHEAK